MRAVVVYESMYGNTREVAEAIAEGLDLGADASVVVGSIHATDATVLSGADLLVVGGPTHVHGMSRESTRAAAAEAVAEPGAELELDPEASGEGVREWLDRLGRGSARAAAFDTRVHMAAMVTGRASKAIAKQLRHHGYDHLADPESFLVSKETHLEPGELERARDWGRRLAELLTTAAAGTTRNS